MKAMILAFGTIFLAELGDKTQLAVLAMRGKGLSGTGIFLGALLAFAIATGIAVLFGAWVHAKVAIEVVEKTAAGAFIVMGILMWFGKI